MPKTKLIYRRTLLENILSNIGVSDFALLRLEKNRFYRMETIVAANVDQN